MKVRLFVSGSAALLAAWLCATYLHEIPVRDYPELGRQTEQTAAAAPQSVETSAVLVSLDPMPAAEAVPIAATE